MKPLMSTAAVLWLMAGCSPAAQPASTRTVAAIEIPLKTNRDHDDLVAMLHRHAAADGQDGIHVDDRTDEWLDLQPQVEAMAPEERGTIAVAVWRGADDASLEVLVQDWSHPGRAWLTFARGEPAERSTRLREGLLADIHARWPDAQPLPLENGVIPLPGDLEAVDGAYRTIPSEAAKYVR